MPENAANFTLTTMLIRLAKPEDAEALCELDARSWSSQSAPIVTDGKKWLGDHVQFEDALVADDASRIIGYAVLARAFPLRITSAQHVGRIQGICVAPERRGQRIARGLLVAADDLARSRGMRKVVLQALASNDSAHRLYLHHGFTIEGRIERCFFIEGRWVDDLHFGKWLV